MGIEPTTPCLQSRCSSQLSYVPRLGIPRTEPEHDTSQVGRAVHPLASDFEADAAIEAERVHVVGLDAEAEDFHPVAAIGGSSRRGELGRAHPSVGVPHRELIDPPDTSGECPTHRHTSNRARPLVASGQHCEFRDERRVVEKERPPLVDGRSVWPTTSVHIG